MDLITDYLDVRLVNTSVKDNTSIYVHCHLKNVSLLKVQRNEEKTNTGEFKAVKH
jgi:hypothetical protein